MGFKAIELLLCEVCFVLFLILSSTSGAPEWFLLSPVFQRLSEPSFSLYSVCL